MATNETSKLLMSCIGGTNRIRCRSLLSIVVLVGLSGLSVAQPSDALLAKALSVQPGVNEYRFQADYAEGDEAFWTPNTQWLAFIDSAVVNAK